MDDYDYEGNLMLKEQNAKDIDQTNNTKQLENNIDNSLLQDFEPQTNLSKQNEESETNKTGHKENTDEEGKIDIEIETDQEIKHPIEHESTNINQEEVKNFSHPLLNPTSSEMAVKDLEK